MEVTTTDKGFKVISMKSSDTIELGGVGICDRCNGNGQSGFSGKYIAALNQWFCDGCFEKWHEKAIYYEEDSSYELATLERTKKTLGIE